MESHGPLIIHDRDLKKMETWVHLGAFRNTDALLLINTIKVLKRLTLAGAMTAEAETIFSQSPIYPG